MPFRGFLHVWKCHIMSIAITSPKYLSVCLLHWGQSHRYSWLPFNYRYIKLKTSIFFQILPQESKFQCSSAKHSPSKLSQLVLWDFEMILTWRHYFSIHIIENLPGTRFFLGHALISGVYSPIPSKFCMEVGLWTLITGKLFWFSFLGNRCYGDQNISPELNNWLFWGWIQRLELLAG